MGIQKKKDKLYFHCPHCQFMFEVLSDYLEHDKFKLALRDGKITPEEYSKFIDRYNKRAVKRIKEGDKIIAETEARFAMNEMSKYILKN